MDNLQNDLSDRLQKSLDSDHDRKVLGRVRVEFISLRYEIESALEERYTTAEIWRQISREGRLSIRYKMFARYVKTLRVIGHDERSSNRLKFDEPAESNHESYKAKYSI